jgi:hypothetical protein
MVNIWLLHGIYTYIFLRVSAVPKGKLRSDSTSQSLTLLGLSELEKATNIKPTERDSPVPLTLSIITLWLVD